MEPLKKALEWLKQNWIMVLVGVVVAFLVWQHFAQSAMVNSLSAENAAQFERYKVSLQEMQVVHERERAAQEEINQHLQENLTRVETEYTTRMSDLEDRSRVRRQTFVRETAGNPEEMAQRLRDRLGWSAR